MTPGEMKSCSQWMPPRVNLTESVSLDFHIVRMAAAHRLRCNSDTGESGIGRVAVGQNAGTRQVPRRCLFIRACQLQRRKFVQRQLLGRVARVERPLDLHQRLHTHAYRHMEHGCLLIPKKVAIWMRREDDSVGVDLARQPV